ncbi:MAG: hypothetical protein R2787_12855 [Saprospiraceae bacterium]
MPGHLTSGTYHLNHIDVSQVDDDSQPRSGNKEIGFVFQTFNLLPRLSARRMLLFLWSMQDGSTH